MSYQIKLAKAITSIVVGRSVSSVVTGALKNVTPTINRSQDLQLVVGSYVLSAMVAERAIDWSNNKFDELLSELKKFRSKHEEETDK